MATTDNSAAAAEWHDDAPLVSRADADLGRGLVQFAFRPHRFALADEYVHVRLADVLRIAAGHLIETAKRGGGLPATADDILAAAAELNARQVAK